MRSTMRTILAAAASLGFGLAWGCGGGAHLSDHYGQRERGAFAAQHVNPTPAADNKAPAGLDSEEAAIIDSQYRKSMGATTREAQSDTRVMLVQEPKR